MLFSHGISTHKHRHTNETKKQMKQFHPQTLYIMQENEKKKKIQIYFFYVFVFRWSSIFVWLCVRAFVVYAFFVFAKLLQSLLLRKKGKHDNEICTNHISKTQKFVFGLSVRVWVFRNFSLFLSVVVDPSSGIWKLSTEMYAQRRCMRVFCVDAITFGLYLFTSRLLSSGNPINRLEINIIHAHNHTITHTYTYSLTQGTHTSRNSSDSNFFLSICVYVYTHLHTHTFFHQNNNNNETHE